MKLNKDTFSDSEGAAKMFGGRNKKKKKEILITAVLIPYNAELILSNLNNDRVSRAYQVIC